MWHGLMWIIATLRQQDRPLPLHFERLIMEILVALPFMLLFGMIVFGFGNANKD